MDVYFRTIGVLAGWFYGALNAFFPTIVTEGTGYLEVAITILGILICWGNSIEDESMRRKSAVSIRKLLELRPTTATDPRRKESEVSAEDCNQVTIIIC